MSQEFSGDDQEPEEECAAGGTRVVAGSGEKGTRATNCRPPETWVVVFFPEGFSCHFTKSAGVKGLTTEMLGATRLAALLAVVR
jgi:hypothetical protein